jgi:signal transduction histidine kinase
VRHEGQLDSTATRGGAPRPRLEKRSAGDAAQDIVINLPLPHPGSDSLFSVQMRYSYASLTDELARTRRREMVALAALLAAGIAGVFVVATRFTRPIQALEASFGRLVQGDLDVRVEPRRQDEIGHLTGSFNEMVERLRESRRMGERLAEAEHLASLGRLAAGVAHEIRNPLNAMLLAVEQMRSRIARASESGGADAARREFERYDALIGDEISRLDRIVASFLDLARSAEVDRRPCDLADGLRATLDLFRPLAEQRGVRLDAELPPALPAVADALRLRTVWNNLFANAIEATPAGGRVTLRAAAPDGGIEVEIADTGGGIPADARARVWEPFWSGRDQGTGLGLSIVRSVVERHGGRVTLDCPPEGGTRVRVAIPAAPPEGAA